MTPVYYYKKEGSGKTMAVLVLDAASDQVVFRFASIEKLYPKLKRLKSCAGCLFGVLSLFSDGGELFAGFDTATPRNWELQRSDGTAIFAVRKIKRGLDILQNDASVGRIEWKKRKKIVDHEVIWGDHLLATAVPNGMLRNEVSLEIPEGTLAVLKQTQSITSKRFGEVYLKRELSDEELGMVLAVGLLWL